METTLLADITDAGRGGFTAVASTGSLDRDGEVLQPGCFNPLPKSVPVHADHVFTTEAIIGRGRPYYVGTKLMVDVTLGSDEKSQGIRQKVKDGLIDSVSVYLRAPQDAYKNIDGVRTLTQAELLSVDVVTVPSNRDALIVSSRGYRSRAVADARADALLAQAEVEIAWAKAFLASRPGTSTSDDVRRFLRSL